MIGILPTLTRQDVDLANISSGDRYLLLNDQILMARGEDFSLEIDGVERLSCTAASITPEAACTSVQLHLQVTPGRFADVWNAAQAVAAVQIAVGANAPFLFGREVWRESAAAALRAGHRHPAAGAEVAGRAAPDLVRRALGGVGVRAASSENLRYFPRCCYAVRRAGPAAGAGRRGTPALHELVLHNGTVYRWNRPVYGVVDGVPHLRVENRVLPAGPTVDDVIANAAFYYGLVRALAEDSRPVWKRMPFSDAAANFDAACRHGLDAELRWPRPGAAAGERRPRGQLVRDELLPLAAAGLDAWGVEPPTGTAPSV